MKEELMEKLIRIAIEEAQSAIQEGNSPFGALLINKNGDIITQAHNTTTTDCDPTAHAEINILRNAAKKLKTKNLSEYTLVSNAESCPMCMSAAIKAKITSFIFGAKSENHMNPNINVFEIARKCNNQINITTGILMKECTEQIKNVRLKEI